MEKTKNYIRYDEVLTDEEILMYAKVIDQFKRENIQFIDVKSIFLKQGIELDVKTNDFSLTKMTTEQANIINKRIIEQNYIYNDINYFILNSANFKNVIFIMDYKAIEVLANSGIREYQQTLIGILKTQLRISYDKDEILTKKRSQWKRKINELESQLSKKR